MNIAQFVGKLNEEKILLNKSEFEKELDSQYKTLVGDLKKAGETVESPNEGGSSSGVKELSKNLRQVYSMKSEPEDFLKSDGSLKNSYSPQFVKAWSNSIKEISDEVKDYTYFWFSGGLYNIHIKSTSLKNPCNWKKWSDVRSMNDLGDDDAIDFLENYLKGWVTFGMIRPQFRYDGIKKLISENAENKKLDLGNVYEMMEGSITNKNIPYIPYDILKGEIAKAFRVVCQKEEKDPDLGAAEFVALNNFLIMIANSVSFDGSKMVSSLKWILDNVLGESTLKRVAADSIGFIDTGILGSGEEDDDTGKMLGFKSSSITTFPVREIANKEMKKGSESDDSLPSLKYLSDLRTSKNDLKKALGNNCYYISKDIYPAIKSHVKRMNSTSFDDVPQSKPFKCIDSKM
jgi:hypothetical protein